MEASGSANHGGVFEDFEPFCVWHRFADREILEVHLQGFKKDNLRVQVSNKNVLIVTGDRPLNDGNKRSRFEKKIELSSDIRSKEIRAKLGGCGTLSLVMPKKIQNPTKHMNGSSKQEERNNGNDVRSGTMKFSDGMGMKLIKGKKIGAMVAVVVLAAMVVGFGAFIAQKYRPKYPVDN